MTHPQHPEPASAKRQPKAGPEDVSFDAKIDSSGIDLGTGESEAIESEKGALQSGGSVRASGRKSPLGRASQGRRDALSGRWVIFAPGRSERPAEILEAELPAPSGHTCPFCAGNESHTPPETYSIRDADEAHLGWTVRVVPNLFPAVSTNGIDRDDLISEMKAKGHWQEADSILHQMLQPHLDHLHFGSASVHHMLRGQESGGDDSNASADPYDLGSGQLATAQTMQRFDEPWDEADDSGDVWSGDPQTNLFEYCELLVGQFSS